MISSTRHLLVWLTSNADRRDHAVTDTELEAGFTARRGEFLAVCGDTVAVGSLYEPPGPPCARCREVAEPRQPFSPLSLLRRWYRRG